MEYANIVGEEVDGSTVASRFDEAKVHTIHQYTAAYKYIVSSARFLLAENGKHIQCGTFPDFAKRQRAVLLSSLRVSIPFFPTAIVHGYGYGIRRQTLQIVAYYQ